MISTKKNNNLTNEIFIYSLLFICFAKIVDLKNKKPPKLFVNFRGYIQL